MFNYEVLNDSFFFIVNVLLWMDSITFWTVWNRKRRLNQSMVNQINSANTSETNKWTEQIIGSKIKHPEVQKNKILYRYR